MIRSLFGLVFGGAREAQALGQTVTSVAEVFRPNATRALELGHEAYQAAHASHAAEFAHGRGGWFDSAVNGLNRLPRPLLALGTLALFIFAMTNPEAFAQRMVALSAVPDPLWWLLGAVVAFYFGAREAHHMRCLKGSAPQPAPVMTTTATPPPEQVPGPELPLQSAPISKDHNAALSEWQASLKR